ncbi:hypothetical protein [Litorivivens sp.]|uniref:hypothetical protein n=1 Tax=Litorivivens sp. TaxID=2020868 RepID=UPI0035618766
MSELKQNHVTIFCKPSVGDEIVPIEVDAGSDGSIFGLLERRLEQQAQGGNTPLYIQIGSGEQMFVALSVADLQALYCLQPNDIGLIAVVNEDGLAEALNALALRYPDGLWLFGHHARKEEIRQARLQCAAEPLYPPTSYPTWSQYLDGEGDEAVSTRIEETIESRQVLSKFAVKRDHIQHLENQRFVFDNLLYEGQITVICAEPNGGKTTVMNWICSQVDEGYQITYLNEDCSGAELKTYQEYAEVRGFELCNLDIRGVTPDQFMGSLGSLSSLKGHVFVLDTLKKFVDVMNKAKVSQFYSLLRRLCNKGATFVLLAHTTKYKDAEGLPKFDGVGDVMNDCDTLIYFLPVKHEDGSMTVSTLPAKTRGIMEPLTFTIDKFREVSLTDYVDTREHRRRQVDHEAIKVIAEAISSGCSNQSEILKFSAGRGVGRRVALRVLADYEEGAAPLWKKARGPNNACQYTLVENAQEYEAEAADAFAMT